MAKAKSKKPAGKPADSYLHPADTVPMRPEIGTQANFRKKKAPKTYRYDSSLSPSLEWDGQTGRAVANWLRRFDRTRLRNLTGPSTQWPCRMLLSGSL